ncbi:spermidine synthase [Paratrimastix pyriformis]|uniref:Spermidine synthase n=1 Tax=Paratrimastix pyriformis TaxID=342808 RepID=A0ABQ8UKM0_9EUKA|nr:spermidine synthase [Paratrimastix pyriformis]
MTEESRPTRPDEICEIHQPGWFVENYANKSANGFAVEAHLHHEVTKFQTLDVYQTKSYGKLMVLDGNMQLTDAHECGYHEMIVHIPLLVHPNPENVLIVGGGDGGVMTQVLRHKCVKHAVQCDIDERVTRVSQQFFPQLTAWVGKDPRAEAIFDDGIAYVRNHPNTFDVIIVDSTDPIGPATGLFNRNFYALVKNALRAGGMVTTQGESIWHSMGVAKAMLGELIGGGFAPSRVGYYLSQVCCYPGSVWGMGFALNSPPEGPLPCLDRPHPQADATGRTAEIEAGSRFYTRRMHAGCWSLPAFAEREMSGLAFNAAVPQ